MDERFLEAIAPIAVPTNKRQPTIMTTANGG